MKINSGYFAGVELKKLNQEKERLDKIFSTGQLEKDTLYVVDDKAQWISFKQKYNDKLFFKETNDTRLISIKSFNWNYFLPSVLSLVSSLIFSLSPLEDIAFT